MRPSNILLPIVLLLAACKEDPEEQITDTDDASDTDDTDVTEPEPATFAGSTEEQRMVALQAAMGVGPLMGWFAVFSAEMDALEQMDGGDTRAAACPTFEVLSADPIAVRYTADGCTSSSGTTYSGAAEAHNMSVFTELLEVVEGGSFDFEGPMKLVFEDFSIQSTGMDWAFDGTFEQSTLAYGEDYRATVDLVSELDGYAFGTKMEMDCVYEGDDAVCTLRDGAEASVEGFGAFGISGTYSLTAMTGKLVLTGADEMIVDFDASVEGCAPVTIDGVAAEPFCFGEPDPEPQDAQITSGGLGCWDGHTVIDASVLGDGYETVQAVLFSETDAGVATETHALSYEYTDSWGDFWDVDLAQGAYVPGSETAFTCDLDATGLLLQAIDWDGDVVSCQVNGNADLVDASSCPE